MAEFLTVMHEVKDFGVWKQAFDADQPNRAAAGVSDIMVVRHAEVPNRVAVLMGVSDRAKAKAMTESPQLRATMEAAGVVGPPTIKFRHGEFTKQDAATYLTLTCTIEGIDKFKRGYAMDAADRKNASLTDLGLMQNVEDPNDLLVLWAVGDVAKVLSFIETPELDEHRKTHAGVTGVLNASFWTA